MAAPKSSEPIVVEQLNHAQWHVLIPDQPGSGVTDWANAMSYALIVAELDGFSVVSQGWQEGPLVMMQAREAAR